MSVWTWGRADRRALLLHCSLARASAWGPVAEALADAGIEARAPDLPGHGRAPMPDPGDDFLDLATQAAIASLPGPAHVVGHSYGGVVAVRVALDRPDLVTGLTLYEPVFLAAARGTPAHAEHDADFAPFASAMAAGDRDRAARIFLGFWGEGAGFDALHEAQREYVRARIGLIPRAGPGMNDDTSGVLPRLDGVRVPVTVMLGARCLPVARAAAIGLSHRLPRARLTELPGAGHMGPVSHPGAVAAQVRADMAQAPGSSMM